METRHLPAPAGKPQRSRGRGGGENRGWAMLDGDTPGVLYGCEYKGFAGIGICKVMKIKGDKNRAVGGSWGGGMVAGEVRGVQWASIVASVGIKR